MRKKMSQYTIVKRIYTSSSTNSSGSSDSPVKENANHEALHNPGIPLLRQKTAILSRRNTFAGKIPVDPKQNEIHPIRIRRPRRSISDESSLSSTCSSSSVAYLHGDSSSTLYQQASHNLDYDERWQKELVLGTRIGLYRLYRDLGRGNFSKVKAAVHYLTKEKVAVKIIDKTKLQPKMRRMLSQEIQTMESVRHPHVIRLFEVLDSPTKVYLAMEFAEGGELFHKITTGGRLPECDAKVIFGQVTSAVIHLHKQNIIHRDLKAENIFMAGTNCIKVGDFGFSTHIHNNSESLGTFCGSPPYAAPELFKKDNYLGPSADLWSLGVLLYFMVTSTLPFKGDSLAVVKRLVTNAQFTLPKFVSDDCSNLIRGLLQADPEKRFTTNQVKASHWMKGVPFPGPINEHSKDNIAAEKETKKVLLDMGLAEDILKENETKGARSCVSGTYRIVLHRLEKTETENRAFNAETLKNAFNCPSFQSRTCVIL